MELTPSVIFALLASADEFPVDFDDAVDWWDCRTKAGKPVRRDNLVQKLRANFHEGSDYQIFAPENSGANKRGSGGHNQKVIRMTIECFKMMGMMLSGSQGKNIRQYFLNCETELKRRLEEDQKSLNTRIVKAFVSDKVESRRPRFSDEFYSLIYAKRGDGWEERNPRNRPPCVGTWTNQIVYDRFPEGVKERLNEVNPRVDGRRKHKQHEHLKPMGSVHLDQHLPAVMAVARISPNGNWGKFMRNIDTAFPNGQALQMNLLDCLEDYEDGQAS